MKRAMINLHIVKHGIASRRLDSVFGEGSKKGILISLTKYRVGDLWTNRDARRRKERRFRSTEDEDHERDGFGRPGSSFALKSVCVDSFVCELNECPIMFFSLNPAFIIKESGAGFVPLKPYKVKP